VTGSPRCFAVLGDPVAHSLSPRMHNAAFRAAGIDAVYVALQVSRASLATVMHTLVANGGGGNVTLPFKGEAAAAGDVRDERVERLGVANVFGGSDTAVHVANTDVDGVLALFAAVGTPSGPWAIVGTGGSARAVVGAAIECGAPVAVRSRSPERAAEFTAWCVAIGAAVVEATEATVVINTTPIGLASTDGPAFAFPDFRAMRAVLDLTYRADGIPATIAAARTLGLPAVDGREMLLVQGAASWRTWFGDRRPPVEVMRAALAGRMG
jgi:shikimate dehydrogenase